MNVQNLIHEMFTAIIRKVLIEYTSSLRNYIRESGNNLAYDEREDEEFVDIFLAKK